MNFCEHISDAHKQGQMSNGRWWTQVVCQGSLVQILGGNKDLQVQNDESRGTEVSCQTESVKVMTSPSL